MNNLILLYNELSKISDPFSFSRWHDNPVFKEFKEKSGGQRQEIIIQTPVSYLKKFPKADRRPAVWTAPLGTVPDHVTEVPHLHRDVNLGQLTPLLRLTPRGGPEERNNPDNTPPLPHRLAWVLTVLFCRAECQVEDDDETIQHSNIITPDNKKPVGL